MDDLSRVTAQLDEIISLLTPKKKPSDRWIFNFPQDFLHTCVICRAVVSSDHLLDHIDVCNIEGNDSNA